MFGGGGGRESRIGKKKMLIEICQLSWYNWEIDICYHHLKTGFLISTHLFVPFIHIQSLIFVAQAIFGKGNEVLHLLFFANNEQDPKLLCPFINETGLGLKCGRVFNIYNVFTFYWVQTCGGISCIGCMNLPLLHKILVTIGFSFK